MSSRDRRPYETATVLDQDFLDKCHDNLCNDLRLVVQIETPDGYIYASDRNFYMNGNFYEALLTFPTIEKTLGEWLQGILEFSVLELRISNVDQRFNDYLPGGSSFGGWFGKTVEVKLGLRDVNSTYKHIFFGAITDVGGFSRDLQSIKIIARDAFDSVNLKFPKETVKLTSYPFAGDVAGENIPIIYGDWKNIEGYHIPTLVVNEDDPNMNGDVSRTNRVKCIISHNANKEFNDTDVYVKRGDNYYNMSPDDIVQISVDLNSFEIIQDSGNTVIEGENYVYESSDEYLVRVIGKDLGAQTSNAVAIAKDILKEYGLLNDLDFTTAWSTYAAKTTPAESAIANIGCHLWVKDSVTAMEQALSLLEQVRLEIYINNDLKFDLNALHFDEFPSTAQLKIENWDIVKDSFNPTTDVKNNFNYIKGTFDFLPDLGAEGYETGYFENINSINQINKEILKIIVFPNLYLKSDVENQIKEILKISSSYIEIINCELTWRALLLDLGDWVDLNVNIQSAVFDNVKCMVRKIGYNPRGLTIPITLWSFQMCPFDNYEPGYQGTVGGYTAGITEG